MRTTALVYSLVTVALAATAPANVMRAQTGQLRGTVTDKVGRQPIENARVTLSGTGFGAMTKADGTYYIYAPYGTYTAIVTATGYTSLEVPNMTVSESSGRQTSGKIIELVPSSLRTTRADLAQATFPMVEQGVVTGSRAPFLVRTFPLQNLTPDAAAKLIAPYLPRDVPVGTAGVYDAGASISAITVRAPKEVLVTVDSLLRVYDRGSATITLHFKLIVATDSATRDAAISDIDATLRQMFRFGGYRQIAEGTTTISERSRFSMTLTTGGTDYYLSGDVGATSGSASTQAQQLTVTLYGTPAGSPGGGRAGVGPSTRSILSTGLTVPIGQTVVIGGATGNDGGRTLILVVRPEVTTRR